MRILALLMLAPMLAAAEPVRVNTAPLAELLTTVRHSAPASVLSLNRSEISAELDARILRIEVNVAERVNPGDVLARLDCRDFERALEQARAELQALDARRELARMQLERVTGLTRKQSVSEELVDQRQAELAVLRAETEAQRARIASAADQVDKCVVRSPFRGLVLERRGQVGELARPGSVLVVVVDLDAVEISAQLLAEDADNLGEAANTWFEYRDERYGARLRAMVAAIDPVSRTREARFVFTGRRAPIGASGRLLWEESGTALPPHLLVQRDGRLGVMTVLNGKAVFRRIGGALEGRPAETSLPGDTQVVTEGHQALRDGQEVTVVNGPASGDS